MPGKATPRRAATRASPKRSPSPSARGAGAAKRAKTALVALPFCEYQPSASLMDDVRTISSMWFGTIDGATHQDRLESFYKNQAELYDGYRARMLHARKPMMTRLMVDRERKGEVVWADLGGGTGANVEFMASAIEEGWFKSITVLDLAPSLCDVARRRAKDKWPGCVARLCASASAGLCAATRACVPPCASTGLSPRPADAGLNTHRVVRVVCGDACSTTEKGLPAAGTCDVVTISYALVMIPDWKAAVSVAARAHSLCLAPSILSSKSRRPER